MTEPLTTAPTCAYCDEPLPDEPYTCTNCGRSPPSTAVGILGGGTLIILGVALSLTVIGAVVGIPMLVLGITLLAASGSDTVAS